MRAQLIPYAEQRRRRCDCCDRTLALAARLLLLDGRALLGDLELCVSCAGAFEALLGIEAALVRHTDEGEFCQPAGADDRIAFRRQNSPSKEG
ncbi:MAG: hypothetical protein H5T97_02975 [Firmicutes bacterium]|nr:hypothetical protein [Bacillota bacterium]